MGADMKITTVQQLRALDPEKVPAYITARGDVMEARLTRWHSDQILLDQVLPATPLVPMQDTHEPPTDDGYVSRNVYDYDEPEPPAQTKRVMCPSCGALDGAHGLVHERFPQGGGGTNKPCPRTPAPVDREALEQDAAERIERIAGWRHLRKYGGMPPEWMDKTRFGIIRAVLDAIEGASRG